MARLKSGDKVDVCIKGIDIINPYRDFDEIKTFTVAGSDLYGYYLYIPNYIILKGGIKADKYKCKSLNIDLKFLDEIVYYITDNFIYKINAVLDGINCKKCNDFLGMAEPNQPDGSFVCWRCRKYPTYN
jgi:hypothetical protein